MFIFLTYRTVHVQYIQGSEEEDRRTGMGMGIGRGGFVDGFLLEI